MSRRPPRSTRTAILVPYTTLVRSRLSSAVYHGGLSAFARLQNDLPALARAYVQATRISCLVGFPIGIGMALLGPLLIRALFGSKWDESTVLLAVLEIGRAHV